jgi:hypothetical protein
LVRATLGFGSGALCWHAVGRANNCTRNTRRDWQPNGPAPLRSRSSDHAIEVKNVVRAKATRGLKVWFDLSIDHSQAASKARSNADLRPECANTGRSRTVWRTAWLARSSRSVVFQFEISVVRPVEIKKRPRVTPPARGQDGRPDGGEIGAIRTKSLATRTCSHRMTSTRRGTSVTQVDLLPQGNGAHGGRSLWHSRGRISPTDRVKDRWFGGLWRR